MRSFMLKDEKKKSGKPVQMTLNAIKEYKEISKYI